MRPTEGEYYVTVTGTGEGTYDLSIRGHDLQGLASGAKVEDVPIIPGVVHSYAFEFEKSLKSGIGIAGGLYGGKGQRPKDVNRFLSYANIVDNRVELPAGTTSFSLVTVYGSTIIPGSLVATLDRSDISDAFAPMQGGSEVVDIPLHDGRNVLTISVEGNVLDRVARDTDRIVFLVTAISD
jgi:hypothetical protein